MAVHHTFVGKIKGSEPEQFVFITLAADFGSIKRTSGPLSEGELRHLLHTWGTPDAEMTSHIDRAQKHPA